MGYSIGENITQLDIIKLAVDKGFETEGLRKAKGKIDT
jgi:hypothetical protein